MVYNPKIIQKLANDMAAVKNKLNFDKLLAQILSVFTKEKTIEFIESCYYDKRPVLNKAEIDRIINYECVISICFEKLGDILDISPNECREIRKFMKKITDGKQYSRAKVVEMWTEWIDILNIIPQFFKLNDVITMSQIILTSFYYQNVIDAHELLDLRRTYLRNMILTTVFYGIKILEIQRDCYSSKA